MGLMDSIVGGLGGANTAGGGQAQSGLLDAITGLIGNSASGGIAGLVDSFTKNGLGDAISSWIGTGQNKPVSGEQVQGALGKETVQTIAQKLNMSPADASSGLAQLLPQVIDKLTPEGKVPEGGLLEQGLSLLKGLGT